MKIGIITIVDNTNYGNRLQNYALQCVLKKMGCKVMTLTAHKEKAFSDGNYLAWCKENVARYINTIAAKYFGKNAARWVNFYKWNKRISIKHYYGDIRLPDKLNNKYDLFFAGSDQIWNYHFDFTRLYNYFLEFALKEKRIAISASFGVEQIPDKWKTRYVEGLKGFSRISVREEAGKEIVTELLGKDVPVLIDPTMMLNRDEWLKVAKKPSVDCSKPYILKYYLGDETEEDKIDEWARKNGYRVYELLNKSIPELYTAGPGEFISLINNATMVCSDSFHCIVFSIIFSRPFIVYERHGKENYMTSRLDTLLNKFGFQNRWKHLLNEDEYLNCDFSSTKEMLEKEQNNFTEYVSNILRG